MATKAKATANGTANAFDSFAMVGNEAFKDSFDKWMKSVDDATSFGRETMDAFIAAANATGKNLETLNNEALGFSKQTVEDGMSAAKAAMTCRSVQELLEINSDFAKQSFDSCMGQFNKMNDLMVSAAKDSAEPLNDRFNALVEKVQSYRP